jgi:hypothetical protein
VTEEAVTRTLAPRRPGKSLLETRKWIFMFVPLYQDHRHTIRARPQSCVKKIRDDLQPRPTPGSRLTGQTYDQHTFNGIHTPPLLRRSTRTQTPHEPTAPAHRPVGTPPCPQRASWVFSVCQTWPPTDCLPQWSRSRVDEQRIRSRRGALASRTQVSCGSAL